MLLKVTDEQFNEAFNKFMDVLMHVDFKDKMLLKPSYDMLLRQASDNDNRQSLMDTIEGFENDWEI